jgi:hypothetical protein
MLRAMKMTSLFYGPIDGQNSLPGLAGRGAAALPGRRGADDRPAGRCAIDFALDADSLWQVTGRVRGARIECHQGRLWLTQSGAVADVILQPGQSFTAEGDGAIVVQQVSASIADGIAFGTVTVSGGVARLKIQRGRKAGAATRLGMELAGGNRAFAWEQSAFIVLWLSGVFGVAYCLKAVLSLPWPY